MCGIFLAFSGKTCEQLELEEHYCACKETINHRGPDFKQVVKGDVDNFQFILSASVLWLQGNTLTKQPVEINNGLFLYNGDIFQYTNQICERNSMESDTSIITKFIGVAGVYQAFSLCQGPFSFIYLDKDSSTLYFGRDHYGRRSLLMGKLQNMFVITSCTKRTKKWSYIELPPLGVFSYNLNTNKFEVMPWKQTPDNFSDKLKDLELFLTNTVNIINMNIIDRKKVSFQLPKEEELLVYKQIQCKDISSSVEFLLSQDNWLSNVSTLNKLLEEAVKLRVAIQPKQCSNCLFKSECDHCLTGILFSGGIDCAILAYLCDKFSSKERPIDLINVAFSKTGIYSTPDRQTGLSTLDELQQLCPDRKWNFVEVNVTGEELNRKRDECIADLIFPLNTVLDDSLGCALWFAARGQSANYRSTCRVLLVGMGADELFGGYTKHRKALKTRGWLGLFQSLEDDWQNLPHRNLARDDRVVSDHGRQLRTPYLDENVVDFVRNLNCWERTCPGEGIPQGFGEKILLRCLAYQLGFRNTAFFKKRALQFGSRVANSKENAKDVSPRLLL